MQYRAPEHGYTLKNGIVIPGDVPFARNVGSIVQTMLNRVKTPATEFAEQKKVSSTHIERVIGGYEAPDEELLWAIERTSPLNVRELVDPRYRHLVPVADDSTNGVTVVAASLAKATERTTYRGNNEQFYTYYHTAVQKRSPIIPELIVEHFEHSSDDPELSDDYFNNGHRERQITIAMGHVNYHWIDTNGNKQIQLATTGDANAINPYTRHSFTVPPGKTGAILAITDLGAIGREDFQALIHPLDLPTYMNFVEASMPVLEDTPISFDALGGFMFRSKQEVGWISKGSFRVRMLMDNITFHGSLQAAEYEIASSGESNMMASPAARWVYVESEKIGLDLDSGNITLKSGDTASIQAGTPHRFKSLEDLEARVYVMESSPQTENALEQLALIRRYAGRRGVTRVHSEDRLWYRDANVAE